MEEQNTLRSFLIKRFIIIMILTICVEYVILLLLNKIIFPACNYVFFRDIDWDVKLGVVQIIYILFITVISLIILFVKSLLPEGAKQGMDWVLSSFDRLTISVVPELEEAQVAQTFTPEQSTILAIVSFLSISLLILPFATAAFVYAREITKEVAKIQKHKEDMQKEYSRKRNLMLSDIAHDLRTPMTTVAGYSKALADGMVEDPKKRSEYLHAIQVKSKRMNDLINLLFEYVRLDSEGFQLTLEQSDLAEVVREAAAAVYSDMEDAGMEFLIDIPEERLETKLDRIQMSRVVTNLLNNAIRHNPRGTRISISMEIVDEQEYQIIVADNGKAIDPAIASHLFEPFAVSDESRNSKGGSGLGLSIAKKIVEMHGWKLSLSNNIPGFVKGFVIKVELDG